MKQTVEEAAKEARMTSAETLTTYGTHTSLDDFTYLSHDEIAESAFIKGADWQSKQSPWISVKGQLPEDTNEKLVMLVDGTIRIAHYDEDYNEDMEYHFWYDCAASESYHRDDVIYWMPIPSFDEMLEANRDVLERIKEKGD